MQYKTIVLEMLEQRTELFESLRQERKVRSTMESYALELKASHEAIMTELQKANPKLSQAQISSEAFELALKELEDRLPPVSTMTAADDLSLEEAMAVIRNPLPRG
jgi:chromosome segregation ATPase